ncbi:hypothetical protein [Microcella sp.]|uniref:hypothetical protein n=1 Tax=Microcella sp. TaxID=1913979 RepID=UPI00391A1864
MSVSPLSVRRALAAAAVVVLAATGALVATSAAPALAAPPTIQGPLDDTQGIFSVDVIPVDNGLEQTIRVYYRSVETGVTTEGCVVVVTTDPDSCTVLVPEGAYGFYDLFAIATDVNGDSPASNTISSLRYGAAASPTSLDLAAPLDSAADPIPVASDGTVVISGLAPALGTVEVLGYRVDLGVGTESSLCLTSAPVAGTFSCPTTFPTFGEWELRVVATDVQGGTVELPGGGATISVATTPTEPDVTLTPGAASVTTQIDGLASATVGGRLVLDAFGAAVAGGTCPASWDGTTGNPSVEGPSVSCGFAGLVPGIHRVEALQFADGVTSVTRDDVVLVPATPTLVVDPFPGGAFLSGTTDTLQTELAAAGARVDGIDVVVRDGAAQPVCVATVTLGTGEWSCIAEVESGTELFTATTEVSGFADDPGVAGAASGYAAAVSTTSAGVPTTIPARVVPPAPSMSYGLGPASIDVTAVGQADSAVGVRLYRVAQFPGDAYLYGEPVDSCGVIIDSNWEGPPVVTEPSIIDDCRFSGLSAGIWNVYSSQYYYFDESAYRDHYVLIPPVPTISEVAAQGGQIVSSGQGEPGYRVTVRQLGASASCDATVAADGAWSCTIPNAGGEVLLRAQQRSQGFVATPPAPGLVESYDGFSAFTAPVSVPVPVVAAPEPLVWTLEGYDGSPVLPGQVLSLSAQGLPAQTSVDVEIRSTPQQLGAGAADDLGLFALDVTIPLDLEPGEHTLVATATPPGGVASVVSIPITVLPAETDDDGTPVPPAAAPSEGSGGSGSAVDRSDPAAASALSDSIPTIDRIFRTPLIALTAGGLALAILLLVAFPAELLNSTVAANSRRLGRWYAAIDDRVERATEWFAAITRTRALAAAVLVVLTALIFGFADPDYGVDPVSLRMTVSLAIGLFVITYVSAWISGAIIQRVWSIPTRVSLQPAALLFAVVGVVIARLLEFSPGFLVGLVIGLDLLTRVGAQYRVRATLTSIGVTVGLALLGWVGYSIVTALATGEPTVLGMLATDALVAIAAEGLTAALASMLPLGFLQGHEIFRRSKGLWAGTFLVVATLFALVVLPTASTTEGEVADVGFWMLVMVIFAAVTLTLWAVLQFTGRDDAEADDEPVEQPTAAAR